MQSFGKIKDTDDPYVIWKKRVYTWLLCAENSPIISRCVPRQIKILIAKLIPVDMTDWCRWGHIENRTHALIWYEPPYAYIWGREHHTTGFAPCVQCFRPCVRVEKTTKWKCLKHGEQSKLGRPSRECEIFREAQEDQPFWPLSTKRDCSNFGLCMDCTTIIQDRENIELTEIYLDDEKLTACYSDSDEEQ